MKNSQKMLKNRKNVIFHVFRSKSVGKSMSYEVWNGLYCHKMHMNYAIFPIVHVHFMTMTSKNSDLLHMSHFKIYFDFYDIKCRVKNELSAGIYGIVDFRFHKQSINSNENFNSLQDLRMSYLDHTNLRQFVSNFKNYIISRINGKAEAVHTHSASEITSGTLDTSRIPNLDASKITTGVIDIDRLPQGALERLVTVANQTARFALTSTDVQLGDTVKQTDTGMMYIVTDTANLANDNGYTEYTAGSATSVPWSGVTGKPTFANVATSGSYNDLTDKPTIPTVPTNYVTTDTTQTVSGQKTWTAVNTFSGGQLKLKSSGQEIGVTPANSTIQYFEFNDKNNEQHGVIGLWDYNDGASEIQMYVADKFKNGAKDPTGASESTFLSFGFKADGNKFLTFSGQLQNSLIPNSNNTYDLGTSAYQWNSVYAQTYYYNGTEFQNKFVTLDTNQTITGNKTFTGTSVFTNAVRAVTDQTIPITENPSAEIVGNNFRFTDNTRFWGQFVPVWGTDGSFRIELGISNWTTTGGQGYWTLRTQISKDFGTLSFYTSHLNANLGTPSNNWNTVWTQSVRAPGTSNSLLLAAMETWEDGARIFMYGKDHTEGCHIYADIDHNDGNHNKTGVRLDSRGFLPTGVSRNLGIADANYKWATLNGINPGALSIPDVSSSSRLDISGNMVPDSYGNISFTPPIYGWVYIDFNVASATITSGTVMYAQVKDNNLANTSFAINSIKVDGSNHIFVWTPVWANRQIIVQVNFSGFSVGKAYIYPCLGNV